MRASGVYWELTDGSVKTPGSSQFVGVVAMNTTKGSTKELIEVTAANMEETIGFNPEYNADYYGLQRVLAVVPSIKVMRLNHNPAIANLYDNANAMTSYAGLHEGESLSEVATTFAVSSKTPGNPGDIYVQILPKETSQSLAIPAVSSSTYTFALVEGIDLTRTPIKVGNTLYAAALYDSTHTQLLAVAGSNGTLLKVVDGVVSATQVGTITASTMTVNSSDLTLTGTYVILDAFETSTKLYTLRSATKSGEQYSIQGSYDFSLVEGHSLYYKKIDLGDLSLLIKSASFNYSLLSSFTKLLNGTNGTPPTVSQLNFDSFSRSGANVCLLMNIVDQGIINAFAQKCESLYMTCLCSAPVLSAYADVYSWALSLYATEFLQLYWIPEVVEEEVGIVYIAPSVNAFILYAQQASSLGSSNYPAAGYTYGRISVNKLLETDYALHQADLKTNKINYQMIGPQGPVMWEQRTRNGRETDLTYANSVFILRDLRERLLNYGMNYNFLYTTPKMLTTFGRGIKTILDDMKDAKFIARYSLHVPTFEEAQAAGRTLTVQIGVAVMQDSEEIIFKVNLQNYNDVE